MDKENRMQNSPLTPASGFKNDTSSKITPSTLFCEKNRMA